MAECCPECKTNEPWFRAKRDEIWRHLEDAMRVVKSAALRVGSADCDVNALAPSGTEGAMVKAMQEAHNAVTRHYEALGVRG